MVVGCPAAVAGRPEVPQALVGAVFGASGALGQAASQPEAGSPQWQAAWGRRLARWRAVPGSAHVQGAES